MMCARASGCTVACRAQGACRAPETDGARLTMALKPATCNSIFAHVHRGRGTCCSTTARTKPCRHHSGQRAGVVHAQSCADRGGTRLPRAAKRRSRLFACFGDRRVLAARLGRWRRVVARLFVRCLRVRVIESRRRGGVCLNSAAFFQSSTVRHVRLNFFDSVP